MARFAALATLNVDDALPDAWVDEVKVAHDYLINAGADLASAASISITSEFHRVTGTTTITTITDAAGQVKSQQVWLQFVSAIQIGTTGNIQTLSGTNSFYGAGDVGVFIYDGTSKWVEVASGAPVDRNQTAIQTIAGILAANGGLSSGGPTSADYTGSQPGDGGFIDSAGQFASFCGAAVTAFAAGATTDSVPRWSVDSNGIISWGPGAAAAQDTTLSRATAALLKIGGPSGKGNYKGGFISSAPGLPATFTPDTASLFNRVAPINVSGTLTIAAPANTPATTESAFIFIAIKSPVGALTVAWTTGSNGSFNSSPAGPASGAGSAYLWVWDPGTQRWVLFFTTTE